MPVACVASVVHVVDKPTLDGDDCTKAAAARVAGDYARTLQLRP